MKKSLRTKQEVRDYLIREDKEDKNEAERYADENPGSFRLEFIRIFRWITFMLNGGDQVAGLYDPKRKEFYIAKLDSGG